MPPDAKADRCCLSDVDYEVGATEQDRRMFYSALGVFDIGGYGGWSLNAQFSRPSTVTRSRARHRYCYGTALADNCVLANNRHQRCAGCSTLGCVKGFFGFPGEVCSGGYGGLWIAGARIISCVRTAVRLVDGSYVATKVDPRASAAAKGEIDTWFHKEIFWPVWFGRGCDLCERSTMH